MSAWRIWVTADFKGNRPALAFELVDAPCVPNDGDYVDVPFFRDGALLNTELLEIGYRNFWTQLRCVTLSLKDYIEDDCFDDMVSVGWIVWTDKALSAVEK